MIRIAAPATVANMGCGFDIIGLALDGTGDILQMEAKEGDGISITNSSGVPMPDDIEKNVITPVIRKFLEFTNIHAHIDVDIQQKIFPGSGIGSSAASSAAAAVGMNELFGNPLNQKDLVICAMEGENLASGGYHADNAAPAVMGGIVLIRGYEPLDIIKIPVPDNLHCAVVRPMISVSTKEAREILPKQIPLLNAITQWGNVGGLVAGLCLNDVQLVGRAMQDVVAEPYRKQFIPGFDQLKKNLLQEGALSMNIAGSGPAILTITDNEALSQRCASIMQTHFAERGIDSQVYISKISNQGAHVIL